MISMIPLFTRQIKCLIEWTTRQKRQCVIHFKPSSFFKYFMYKTFVHTSHLMLKFENDIYLFFVSMNNKTLKI